MILVTGGAGFIGSNILAGLEKAGHTNLAVCDDFGNLDKWRNVSKREISRFVPINELWDFLKAHEGKIETIFHMGAISSTTENDVDKIIKHNFRLSIQLWQWCAKHNTRFIYASSAATYGDGTQGFNDGWNIDGLAKLNPLNPYGWSKHVFDRVVGRMVTNGEPTPPQWAGLKFFNVYGANEYHKGDQQSVASHLFQQIIRGAAAKLFISYHDDYKDGEQQRDFVYVDDCVGIMMWLHQNKNINGLFNVGTGKARSFNDLANALFAALGRTPNIEYIDMPEGLKNKYQYFTQANMNTLQHAGYTKSFTSLEDGVADYVKNYLNTQDPYK